MARRRRLKKHENHDRWIVTYSDLITLLLVFFIVMFSMSSVNKERFATLEQSLYQATHPGQQVPLPGLGTSALLYSGDKNDGRDFPTNINNPSGQTITSQQTENASQDQARLDRLLKQIEGYIAAHHLTSEVRVADQPRGIQITMKDVALFNTGQAMLLPGARHIITGFVPFFKSIPNNIVVEGYTDDEPIDTAIYPSNWELSAARAMSVVHFLSNDGVKPDRLSGTGYGEYQNIAPNTTAAGRQQNRRVNIVVLRQDLAPDTAASQP